MGIKETINQNEDYLNVVQKLVKDLDYGKVTIVVQDGKVIQVEQNRKIRLK